MNMLPFPTELKMYQRNDDAGLFFRGCLPGFEVLGM